jgi:hypothetical protein
MDSSHPGTECDICPSISRCEFIDFILFYRLILKIFSHLAPSSKGSSRVNSRYDFTVECEISGALNLVTHLGKKKQEIEILN